ncbi:MAG: peptide chain release factor 1 [FCB group bacterium]|nr:peptide chain release factor 1 [FCB group bacterium]
MIEKLREIKHTFDELSEKMALAAADPQEYAKLAREYSRLEKIVKAFDKYESILNEMQGHKSIISEGGDEELAEMAKEELPELEAQLGQLEKDLKLMLLPPDPNDSRNIVVEIRAGTGGEEAGLFAGDLYKMYIRYAESRNWKSDVLSSSPSDMGGFKEIIFSVTGDGVYARMKFESGVHRVQRVPATEASGRIHTSAATVAVMPEAEDVEIAISPDDLRVDVYRSTGHGGQSVNTTDSAVRLTHIPTGLVVTCQDEKSQLKNKIKAMKVLRARLYDAAMKEKESKESEMRRKMVSTGDRSAKIRTYNFPQGRVTDHRIKLTLYKLDAIMQGDIEELIESIRIADSAEQLANLETVS